MTITLNYPAVAKYRRSEKYFAARAANIANKKVTGEWYEQVKNRQLRHKYGIDLEHYNNLLERQGYVCAVCKKPESIIDHQTKNPRALAVDHCHKTKVIRGLLCQACNVAIGKFKDDISLLGSAIEYIKNNGVTN